LFLARYETSDTRQTEFILDVAPFLKQVLHKNKTELYHGFKVLNNKNKTQLWFVNFHFKFNSMVIFFIRNVNAKLPNLKLLLFVI
jgi:hypothetical protein